jgi:hypothetical protein
VAAIVAEYFEMLKLDIRGERYNKLARNRALQRLTGRSHGAIEKKHENISAVLRDLGCIYIEGYKPLSNYQESLYTAVAERLAADRELARTIAESAAAAPLDPPTEDILRRLVAPPATRARRPGLVAETPQHERTVAADIDYVAQEARNAALGKQGELWVVAYERARLIAAGKETLADRIEHVAVTEGPSAGFDIRSFEANGTDRLIEVKTTGGPIAMPFFVSPNEVETSRKREREYHLYRPFRFNRDPRLFIVPGRLDRTCRLQPAVFRAEVA